MNLSKQKLGQLADQLGYRAEILEKVLWLMELLEAIARDTYLGPRLALKGGTALNLFVLELPRLSVDIDLNYIGSADKAVMEAERPKLMAVLKALCQGLGLRAEGAPDEHAGGKWHMAYKSQVTENGNIEVDLNFLQRLPLWDTVTKDSHELGGHQAKGVRVLDAHDLYGAASRTDWRKVKVTDVNLDLKDVQDRLVPVLSKGVAPDIKALKAWSADLERQARSLVTELLPLKGQEREFLDRLLGHGNIAPELLTHDAALAQRIAQNPALTWKALNVKGHIAKGGKP